MMQVLYVPMIFLKKNESWLAFLGIGGNILDDTYYNGARYLKDDPEYELYMAPSYDFCKNNYGLDGWMTTDEYRFELIWRINLPLDSMK